MASKTKEEASSNTLIEWTSEEVQRWFLLNYSKHAEKFDGANGKDLARLTEAQFQKELGNIPGSIIYNAVQELKGFESLTISLGRLSVPNHLAKLFDRFPDYPQHHNETTLLQKMLTTPLTMKLPLAKSLTLNTEISTIFEHSDSSMSFLSLQFYHALYRPIPANDASEISWQSYYDCFLHEMILCDYMKGIIEANRNVEDDSLTLPLQRRDFNAWCRNLLVICGEDKRYITELYAAENELMQKNKGSNAACYGNLNYILSFVTAGPAIKFFALPISPKGAPKCISRDFNMFIIEDRVEVLVAFVNMCRWCCTIQDELSSLPTKLHKPITRTSPFNYTDEVEIIIHHDYVTKKFTLYKDYYLPFLSIYQKCRDSYFRHCINLKSLSFDGTKLASFVAKDLKKKSYQVIISLFPVGQQRLPKNEQELKIAIRCVLEFLEDFHNQGFVHQDLRWPNILHGTNGWFVIDLENAGLNNSLIFWDAKVGSMPDTVRLRLENYTTKIDLYQVGNLILNSFKFLSYEAVEFGNELKFGKISNAKEALQNPWLTVTAVKM